MSDQQKYYNELGVPEATGELDYNKKTALRFLRQVIQRLESQGTPPTSVLDVGCGPGVILSQLPSSWRRMGVDISPVMVEAARRNQVQAEVCDLEVSPLPFPDASIDLVCCTVVLEHIVHTDHVINEINRVLKPGGTLVASVPNVSQPASFIMMLLDFTPVESARYRAAHYRDFTARIFKQLQRKHGFEVIRCSGCYVAPFRNARWSCWLADRVPRLGGIILTAATKRKSVVIPEGFSGRVPELWQWLKEDT